MTHEPKNIKEEIKESIELMAKYILTDNKKKKLKDKGLSSGYEEALDFLIEKEYKFFSKKNTHLFVTMVHRLAVIKKYLDTIKKSEVEFNNKTIVTGAQHISAIEQIFDGLLHDCLFIIGEEEDNQIDFDVFKDD